MGSPPDETGSLDDEHPQHMVQITRPFYLGVYLVTQAEYVDVTGQKNPSWCSKEGSGQAAVAGLDTSNFPVEQVSWEDAAAFCQSLNVRDKKRPPEWKYGLPTEAEWEYACRAGSKATFFFGDDPKDLGDYAWYSDNAGICAPMRWGRDCPTHGAYMICTATSSNWCATGMTKIIIFIVPTTTLKAATVERSACYAVVPGETVRRTVAPRFATATCQALTATTADSASVCTATKLLFSFLPSARIIRPPSLKRHRENPPCQSLLSPPPFSPCWHCCTQRQAQTPVSRRCLPITLPRFCGSVGSCHNSTKKRGGLDLTTREQLLAGGDTGPVVKPGAANESLLLRMVSGAEAKMPKKGRKLTADEAAGAAPMDQRRRPVAEGRNIAADKPAADDDWWSLHPLIRPAVPALKNKAWVRTPIDAFVLAAMEAKGLHPSPPADKATLLRRVTFDLIGLPPTPEEIDAFLGDNSQNAYEKVVDRLLASPRYGERWGGTGSMWSTTPTRTATTKTNAAIMRGPIAITSFAPSTATSLIPDSLRSN